MNEKEKHLQKLNYYLEYRSGLPLINKDVYTFYKLHVYSMVMDCSFDQHCIDFNPILSVRLNQNLV